MGALPNVLPRTPRKQPARAAKAGAADLRSVPRDLAVLDAEFRGAAETAWTPVPTTFDSNRFRLASGGTFWALTSYLIQLCGRKRKANQPLPLETELDILEASMLLRVAERSINRELAYMQQRDMAIVARLAGGKAIVRLLLYPEMVGDKSYPGWSAIKQCYAAWASSQRVSLDEQSEEIGEDSTDEVAVKAGIVTLTKRPRKIRAGAKEKALPVNVGVKSYRMDLVEDESALDVSYTAAVHSGEFIATVCVPKRQTLRSNLHAKRVESTTSEETSGRTCPNRGFLPPNEGIANYPHTRVVNAEKIKAFKRSSEIADLFDPHILRHGKSLSADFVAWQTATEVITSSGVSPTFLADQVAERGRRDIRTPRAAVEICREIAANWQRVKNTPDSERLPTMAEIDEICRLERLELAKQRSEMAKQKRKL